MKYTNEATYNLKGNNISFKYVEFPTLIQQMRIVDDIVNGVVSDIVGYEPILYDYFTTVALIQNLTTIDLPSSFIESSEFIEKTNMGNILRGIIPSNIIESISKAADKKIEFKKLQLANTSKLDELLSAITILINKYSESLDGIDIEDFISKLALISEMANMPKSDMIHNILQYEDIRKSKNINQK